MTTQYKIRKATHADKEQIQTLIRESVAKEKSLLNPALVHPAFIEQFVDKVIAKGNMLVVENARHELELIGEVHYYNTGTGREEDYFQEFSFVSRIVFDQHDREKDLVNWLYNEIESKHHRVFRVELMSPVCNSSSVDLYKKMGLTIEGRLRKSSPNMEGGIKNFLPLSWINPSFN